jgi:hypothetical protein
VVFGLGIGLSLVVSALDCGVMQAEAQPIKLLSMFGKFSVAAACLIATNFAMNLCRIGACFCPSSRLFTSDFFPDAACMLGVLLAISPPDYSVVVITHGVWKADCGCSDNDYKFGASKL